MESNQIGKQDPNGIWADNVVTIEEDRDDYTINETSGERVDVYVGGPASLCAAAIQAKSDHGQQVLYAHDGQRGYSNWKGSASYFHIRDALPLYYWPGNNGISCIYITLKHAIERRLNLSKYIDEVKSHPSWYKLRLSFSGRLKDLQVLGLFAENQYRAFNDVGINYKGKRVLYYHQQVSAESCR